MTAAVSEGRKPLAEVFGPDVSERDIREQAATLVGDWAWTRSWKPSRGDWGR